MDYIQFVAWLKKRLPQKVFNSLQQRVKKLRKALNPPLTEEIFRRILTRDMKISPGSVVFVHSSVGHLDLAFSPNNLLPILLETVGPEGTLLFPATQFLQRAEEYLKANEGKIVLDSTKTRTVRGALSEAARKHPEAFRSLHPTDSVVAIGKYARELTETHHLSLYPLDENSPYYKMMQYNAYIIGLGVSTFYLTFVHCLEDVMKNKFPVKTRMDEVFTAQVKAADGSIVQVKTKVADERIGHRDLKTYFSKYIPNAICRNFTYKGRSFFVTRSAPLYEEMKKLAQKNVTIYTKEAYTNTTP